MIDAADLAALRDAAGDAAVRLHEPVAFEGATLDATLAPADADALARALGVLSARGLPVLMRGAGSQLGLGNPPRGARLWLSLEHLAGEPEVDAEEGVVRVTAATPIARVRERAAAAGWTLPIDPATDAASVGGMLATGAAGPRSLAFGRPRDAILGLDCALATGERVKCGGRVVKNVTGYDLAKLYAGSLGTLAVIVSGWLRLRPRPEHAATRVAPLGEHGEAAHVALDAARLPSARAVAALDAPLAARVVPGSDGGRPRLVVELAGDEAVVEEDARRLERALGATEIDSGVVDRLRALGGAAADTELRLRVSCRPSRLADCAAILRRGGAAVWIQPGLASVHARIELDAPGDPAHTDAAFALARAAARAGEGSFVVETAPLEAKRGRDVFGDAPASLPLMRALKTRFDPAGILNPGRFIGGI